MQINSFYHKLVELLTKEGKGDREVTLSINGFAVPIKDVVWHERCNEFHIVLDTTDPEQEALEKRAKSWMN